MFFHTWGFFAYTSSVAAAACSGRECWFEEADEEAIQHASLLQQGGWRQESQQKTHSVSGRTLFASESQASNVKSMGDMAHYAGSSLTLLASPANSTLNASAENSTATTSTSSSESNRGQLVCLGMFSAFALLIMGGIFGGRRFGRSSSDWNFLWEEGGESHAYGVYPKGIWAPDGISKEIFSGAVVTFAQVPASVAFAALGNMPSPMIGLHAAWMVGMPCALLGGRPGMIVGSAAALASVTKHFVTEEGLGMENLFCSVMLAGLLIAAAGWMQIGSLMAYVPKTVMMGFCNGLAIVIGIAQLDWFKDEDKNWLPESMLLPTLVHAFISCSIVAFLPRLTSKIPAHFIAIVFAIFLEFVLFRNSLGWHTMTVDEKTPILNSEIIPRPFFVSDAYKLGNIDIDKVLLQAFSLATVASLESLLTLERMDKETQSSGDPNRQLLALGAGNLLSGFFGTMGGTALIELSVMNANIGGRGRVSSFMVSLGILSIILFASPVLRIIPCGTLAGIMIDAVLNTAMWESIIGMLAGCMPAACLNDYLTSVKLELFDSSVILVVAVVTWQTNLAYGVFAGLGMKFLHGPMEKKSMEHAATEASLWKS